MKRIAKIVSVLLIAAIMVSCFAGCAGIDKKIIGKWGTADSGNTIEFREDGTVSCKLITIDIGAQIDGTINGTYTLNTEADPVELTIVPTIPIVSSIINVNLVFTVSIEKDTLTLVSKDSGDSYIFERAE